MNSPSYWFDAVPDEARFSTLQQSATADVVVVGGGLAGIMTAYLLAKQGRTVMVVEQNHLATGDTGFTTAFLTRELDADIPRLVKRYGFKRLQTIYQQYQTAQQLLFQLIQTEQIDCNFKTLPSYHYSTIPKDPVLLAEWEIVHQLDPQADWLEGEALAGLQPQMAAAIRFNGEGSFHIRKFILGLLKTTVGKNIQVYENTVVTGFDLQAKQVVVQTAGGNITAQQLVVTTGLPTNFPEWHHLFETKLSYVTAAQYAGPAPVSDGQFWDTAEPYHYFRKVDDQTIILGGEDRYGSQAQPAQTPYDTLQGWAQHHLPGEPTWLHHWSGSLFETEDGLPFITEHPHHRGRVYLACGFVGNGMVGSIVAANLLSQLTQHQPPAVAKEFSLQRTKQTLAKITTSNPQTLQWWKWPARLLFFALYFSALVLPAWIFFQTRSGLNIFTDADVQTYSVLLFPLVGLYAFTFVWAQLLLGAGMGLWRRVFSWIEPFHRAQGAFVLLLALLHPTMIAYGYGLELYLSRDYVAAESLPYLYLGYFQLLLLFCTVGTAILMKWKRLKHLWLYVHLANYVVFISAWAHGWFLGSDVRFSALRYLWLMYAATAALAVGIRLYNRFKPVSSRVSTGGWVVAAQTNQVLPRKPYYTRVGQLQVALFNLNGKYYALDNVCSHAGGPLCQGPLDEQTIQCPWHESKFDVTTGQVLTGPARRAQRRFETKVEGEKIYIKN